MLLYKVFAPINEKLIHLKQSEVLSPQFFLRKCEDDFSFDRNLATYEDMIEQSLEFK